MYNKTYFFRDNYYTLYEMIERIPKENFINLVELHCSVKAESKDEAKKIFIDRYNDEECYNLALPCFEQFGQKGDKLNICLYDFKSHDFAFDLNQFNKIIRPLVGKPLNEIPMIGSFCNSPCILEEYRMISNYQIDFKFNFEVSLIKEDNGIPISVIENINIECRYYIDKKVIAVVDNRQRETKSALNIIYVLPYFIKMNVLSEGNTIEYANPEFDSLQINSTQLQLLKLIFNGKLRSTEIAVSGEAGVKFKMTGDSENFESESKFYNENTDRGLCTAISFFTLTSGFNNVITIKSSGSVMSSNYIDENILNKTVSLIYKVDLCKDYLFTVDEIIINKYCNMVRLGMPTRIKHKNKTMIVQELTTLIDEIITKYKLSISLSNVYFTIILNIIIKLACSEATDSCIPETDINKYGKLRDFMLLYIKKEYKINLVTENINYVVNGLIKIISNANSEAALINFYQNNY